MKKSLIAAAAMSAFAGVAHAQSSVSVYGVLDLNVQSVTVKNSPSQSFALGNEASAATSRLGFRGVEDLGGGNSVSFMLEGCLNPNTAGTMGTSGTNSSSDVTTAAKLFNREAHVQLTNNRFGSLRLGTSDVTDAGNIEVFTSRIGNAGFNSVTDIDTDLQQSISYRSPVLSGFRFQVGHSNNQQTASSATSISTGAVTSMFAAYTQGALELYYGSAERKANAAAEDVKQSHYGLRYNAGVVDFGAYYGIAEGVSVANTTGVPVYSFAAPSAANKFKMQRYTASVPLKALGSGVSAGLLYGIDEAAQASSNQGDSKIYQAGLSKSFSKRTTGYVSYRVQNFENASTFDRRTTAVGVVHSF